MNCFGMLVKPICESVIALVNVSAYAVDHTVGGGSGWTTGFNYDNWASSLTFTTADTLVFNYGFTHAVDEVPQADYQSCSSSNSISSDSNSPTTITLSTPGTRYFICPRSNHCSQGMRLTVTIVAGNSTSPSAPTTPSGSPGTPTSTTPSGTRSPPPQSGATSIMEGRKGMMVVGSSLVVAAVFGLMS